MLQTSSAVSHSLESLYLYERVQVGKLSTAMKSNRRLTTRQPVKPLTRAMYLQNLRHKKMQEVTRNAILVELVTLAFLLFTQQGAGMFFIALDLLAFALTAIVRATT